MNTRTGIDHRLLAAGAYLGLITLGLIPGILLLLEPENRLIKFHSIQCLFLVVINVLISTCFCIFSFILGNMGYMGGMIACLLNIPLIIWGFGLLALAIFLAIKAYNEEYYKLPIIGDQAERIAFRQ
jgi:uncharacterized membrane protein